MKSRYLIKLFFKHMEELGARGNGNYLGKTDKLLIVYGTDEFSIDRQNRVLVLDGLDSIECPKLNSLPQNNSVEWVGIVQTQDSGFSAVFGVGNPFDGDIPAVPYSLTLSTGVASSRLPRKKI